MRRTDIFRTCCPE